MVKKNSDIPVEVTVNQQIGGYSVEMVFQSESSGGTIQAVKEQIQQAYAERMEARYHKGKAERQKSRK